MSPEEDRTLDAVDSEPKHYQLSYSGPPGHWYDLNVGMQGLFPLFPAIEVYIMLLGLQDGCL